ncbi:MAG: dockerin type I repeat-containing protein [Planctomycetes bacterium]|nr:dockerin type I repeat-containing protein [Planctomycetota bacterium]
MAVDRYTSTAMFGSNATRATENRKNHERTTTRAGRGVLIVAAVLLLAEITSAQTGIPGGAGHEFELQIPGTSVEIGATFDLPIYLETDEPAVSLMFITDVDPGAIAVLDVVPGSALETFQTLYGPPPVCDIVIYPDLTGAMVVMTFGTPFDSSVVGSEFLILRLLAVAPLPTESEIFSLTDIGDTIFTPVSIVASTPFRRGDVNADASCDLTDGVRILQHLFAGNPADCLDAADIDNDGQVTLPDAVLLLQFLFQGGVTMDDSCQPDSSPDQLLCPATSCP